MQEILSIFEMGKVVREGDLVLLDIDETLVQPAFPPFQMKNVLRFEKEVEKVLQEVEENALLARIIEEHDDMLIEEGCVEFISKLPGRKLAFTALRASRDFCELRIKRLEKMGFQFTREFPEEVILTQLEAEPFMKDGVLFSQGERRKGEVFAAFIEAVQEVPDRVVFIDDRVKNLEDVAAVYSGEFVGLHYVGASHYPAREVSKEEFLAALSSVMG